MKNKLTKKQKTNGVKLWNSVKDEVYFTDEFNLQGELKIKADKYLHTLKLRIWRISLANGSKNEALKVVCALSSARHYCVEFFAYNKAINNLLAEIYEPWTKTKPVDDVEIKRASIWDLFKSATDYKLPIGTLDPMHLSIGDVISVQWRNGCSYFNYEVMPDCETLHVIPKDWK